ncbi:MAG: hypothetical protein IJ852_01270 [Alphaproteobacteria bacterium]|nr:hypothetical protein [Alphaproteobacteria bacterium]
MQGYLDLKDEESRRLAQMAGNAAELGGAVLTGRTLNNAARYGYDQANMAYNGYKIGRKYDQLVQDPFRGSGRDVMARMKNHNGEPVVLQRGEAIVGENGEVITSGRPLQHITGTERNHGLNKIIYKHEMPRNEVIQIPRYIKQNKPVEISPRGQNVYAIQQPNGEIRIVTTPKDGENIVSSMYFKIKK